MKRPDLKPLWDTAKARYLTSGLPARIDPLLARYHVLPAQQKKQVKMGAALALIVMHGFLFLTPTLRSFIDFNSKIARMSSDLNQAEADIGARTGMEKVFSDADRLRSRLLEQMIQAGDAPRFLDALATLAKDSGARIGQLKPWRSEGGLESRLFPLPKGFSTTGYEMSVTAGYHELGKLVALMENNPKVIHILEVKISHDPGDPSRTHRGKIIFQLLEASAV